MTLVVQLSSSRFALLIEVAAVSNGVSHPHMTLVKA